MVAFDAVISPLRFNVTTMPKPGTLRLCWDKRWIKKVSLIYLYSNIFPCILMRNVLICDAINHQCALNARIQYKMHVFFSACHCTLTAHIHWNQITSTRLINDHPSLLLPPHPQFVNPSVFPLSPSVLPLCPFTYCSVSNNWPPYAS